MYKFFYHKLFLRKIKLTALQLFFFFIKFLFLFIFWFPFLALIYLIISFLYFLIKKYKKDILVLYNYNGYLSYYRNKKTSNFLEKDFDKNLDETLINPFYLLYFTEDFEEDPLEESIADSSEYFLENPNFDDEELIDDFDEITLSVLDFVSENILIKVIKDENNFIEVGLPIVYYNTDENGNLTINNSLNNKILEENIGV